MSNKPVSGRVDATTSTHCHVATDTSYDNMNTAWDEHENSDRQNQQENGGVEERDTAGGGDGQEQKKDAESSGKELAAENELAKNEQPLGGQGSGDERKDDNMVVADSPVNPDGVTDNYGDGAGTPLFDGDEEGDERLMGGNENEEPELDPMEELEREVDHLKSTIINLEDENQDLKIHYMELQRSVCMACSLEYAQRMELNDVCKKLTEVEEENKTLKEKILLLEQEITTLSSNNNQLVPKP